MSPIFLDEVIASLRQMANTPNIANMPIDPKLAMEINERIAFIVRDIQRKDPILSQNISSAMEMLFVTNSYGQIGINPIALGQVIFALNYLSRRGGCGSVAGGEDYPWSCIHPAIVRSSKSQYVNGHYAQASVDAFIEFNARAKKRYREICPDVRDVPDGRDLMNKLFAPSRPMLRVCCAVPSSERDCQEGYHLLASGAMAALRNPKSHSNEEVLTAEEAMQRLMFASMLMYWLDESLPEETDEEC